jgi:hypothetical protein
MVDRDTLRQRPAHRDTGEVGAAQPERVEYGDRVGGQVSLRVARRRGRVRDGLPGVPAVVPDHEPAARREPFTEFVLPPVHRRTGAADEQDRRITPVTGGIHAQVDAVDAHDCAAHSGSSQGTASILTDYR